MWSRPTILAVAKPMPPAPPVITDTRFITGPYTRRVLPRERGALWFVVGVTAVPDRRPDERRPDGGGEVAAVDDQPGEGHHGVDAAEHQPSLCRGERELDDEQQQ